MKIKQLLKNNKNIATKEKQIFLQKLLNKSRSWIIAHEEYELDEKKVQKYNRYIARREKSEPVNYIIGRTNFFNRDFLTDKRALIPRPETEELIEHILEHKKNFKKNLSIIDIGTGSGIIAITLFHELKDLNPIITASDISQEALDLAKANARKHGAKIKFLNSDLLQATTGKFDLIIANLPYIPHYFLDRLEKDINYYEPELALNGGADGLELIKKLLDQTKTHLEKNGLIFLEIWHDQADKIKIIMKKYFPNAKVSIFKDMAGHDRFVEMDMAG